MAAARLVAAATLATVGCGSPAPRPPPALDPARAPWNAIAAVPPQSAELDALLQRIALVRQLAPGAPPALASVERGVLVERALALVERQEPPSALDAETRWWWALELVPAGFAWQPALRSAFEASSWAFYDPGQHEIVLDAALAADDRRRVLAHELVHALVDQHFGLAARLADARATSDARAALHLLAEGDAEAVVAELWPDAHAQVLPEPSAPDGSTPASDLPPVLRSSLAAAYVDGVATAQRLRAEGGWGALDALYRAPPRSTSELLRPLDATPAATPAAQSTPLGPAWIGAAELVGSDGDWRLLHGDMLGEQALRVVLEQWLPAARATELASGWDGDRLSVFERATAEPAAPAVASSAAPVSIDAERVLVWELRWRSALAASGTAALREALHLEPIHAASNALACRQHHDAGVVGQWARDTRLWFVHLVGAPERSNCERLRRWARASATAVGGGEDPGPRRLIGPR